MDERTTEVLDQPISKNVHENYRKSKEIWFNDTIKQQRSIVRRNERIWRKQKSKNHLNEFKSERSKIK